MSSPTRKRHRRLRTHPKTNVWQVDLNTRAPTCGAFAEPSDGLEPSTPSLPWRFRDVTYVHGRARSAIFSLQIEHSPACRIARPYPRLPSLVYPSRTRAMLSVLATEDARQARANLYAHGALRGRVRSA